MTRYLISFDDGAMSFPEEELPDVAEAAHAVVQEAKDYGVWVSAANCIPTKRCASSCRPDRLIEARHPVRAHRSRTEQARPGIARPLKTGGRRPFPVS